MLTVAEEPVESLVEHPDNPRRGDVASIVESIRVNGWWGVVVAQLSTRYVLVGNHRLRAARELGLATVPVHWLDVDDARARRILLADNRTSDFGTYDEDALVGLLSALGEDDGGLAGTGYTDGDLALLLQQQGGTDSYGSARHGQSPAERVDAYEAVNVRTIILPYDADTHRELVEALAHLRAGLRVETFADVVATLIRDACAELTPEAV